LAKEEIVSSLDIGTTKVCAVVSAVSEEGEVEVLGYGSKPASGGLRKGVIIHLDNTVKAIEGAVEQAEQMSGQRIKNVITSVGGIYLKGMPSDGNRSISRGNKEITKADINAVIEAACELSIPLDQEIFYISPQEYIVDGHDGVKEPPLGLIGENLGIKVMLFMGAITSMQNIIKSINSAGLRVRSTVPGPLASSLAVLAEDEINSGVALVDMGGGTTSIAVFVKGYVIHTCVLGLGGEQVTGDIAVGVRSSPEVAEKLKKEHGRAITAMAQEGEVDVPGLGGRGGHTVSKLVLCEIIQARLEEILELVRAEIKKTGYEDLLSAGVVLTGGVANTDGLVDLAGNMLRMPVRIGKASGITAAGEATEVSDPSFSVATGLLMQSKLRGVPIFGKGGLFEGFRKWWQNFF